MQRVIASARTIGALRARASPSAAAHRLQPPPSALRSTTTAANSTGTGAPPPPPPPPPQKHGPAAMALEGGTAPDGLPRDALPRFPVASTQGVLRALDYLGTLSFAHSGALLAAASGMDVLGTLITGTITAVGGGTIRDAVILAKRPFWTEEVEYLYLALGAAAASFALWHSHPPEKESTLEFAADAAGVAAFAVIGAQNGVRAGLPVLPVVVCGVATATFGGVVRDVLIGRRVRILHSYAEIYATTAAAGAAAYVMVRRLAPGAGVGMRVGIGLAVAGGMRCWAWLHGVRLAVWNVPTSAAPTP